MLDDHRENFHLQRDPRPSTQHSFCLGCGANLDKEHICNSLFSWYHSLHHRMRTWSHLTDRVEARYRRIFGDRFFRGFFSRLHSPYSASIRGIALPKTERASIKRVLKYWSRLLFGGSHYFDSSYLLTFHKNIRFA